MRDRGGEFLISMLIVAVFIAIGIGGMYIKACIEANTWKEIVHKDDMRERPPQ